MVSLQETALKIKQGVLRGGHRWPQEGIVCLCSNKVIANESESDTRLDTSFFQLDENL